MNKVLRYSLFAAAVTLSVASALHTSPFSYKTRDMTEHKFSRYDSADYLDSEAAIAAYLDAAKGEGDDDPAYMAHLHGVVARARASIGATSTANETEPNYSNG